MFSIRASKQGAVVSTCSAHGKCVSLSGWHGALEPDSRVPNPKANEVGIHGEQQRDDHLRSVAVVFTDERQISRVSLLLHLARNTLLHSKLT